MEMDRLPVEVLLDLILPQGPELLLMEMGLPGKEDERGKTEQTDDHEAIALIL